MLVPRSATSVFWLMRPKGKSATEACGDPAKEGGCVTGRYGSVSESLDMSSSRRCAAIVFRWSNARCSDFEGSSEGASIIIGAAGADLRRAAVS